jgi:shikimate kinase/uncharacterized membrane protein
MSWIGWALLSAGFAAATALFAKVGVANVDSNLATALRTTVVVIFAWGVAVAMRPSGHDFIREIRSLHPRTLVLLGLSGLATGASWLCYFRALQLGPVSRVAPLDKLSVPLVMLFAWLLAGEKLNATAMSWRSPDYRRLPSSSPLRESANVVCRFPILNLDRMFNDAAKQQTIGPTTIRIVLTGFMGSGKSTVGPLLAERLHWRFVDVDAVIEAESGTKIADLFGHHGESAFREREEAAIAKQVQHEKLVLALGGGAIERVATRKLLLNQPGTLLIHLEASLETTLLRCAGTEGDRPVLADRENLAKRYGHRLPLYREAHVSIPTDALTPDEVVTAILQCADLEQFGPWPQ